jgi:hypothetical protein
VTTAQTIVLRRSPKTDDELWWLFKALWGVEMPRVSVCPDHVSPFTAVANAYFGRAPGYAVWYASRGSGKSLALAVLGLTKTLVEDINCTILGGSMTQSQNVAMHMKDLLMFPRAPLYALKGGSIEKGVTATQITMATGKWLKPIPASQTTVRGPHPPLSLLDEVDEMEWDIYEAAMGQAMEQMNTRGEIIQEYIVASSTWQNPLGTFTKVIDNARKRGLPVYSWCWRELLEPHGWMTQRFIDQKRQTVSAEMWRTEYELNEPSGDSRAFDLTKLEECFVDYGVPIDYLENGEDDQTWVWSDPDPIGAYAVGADWAQEKDKTVIACIRVDVSPRRLVYLRRVNKQPYPKMMKSFDDVVRKYNATGRHDKTGLGTVVNDFLDTAGDEGVEGFNFSGKRKRSQMLLAYVTAVEQGLYLLPRGTSETKAGQFLAEFHRGHRGTTTGDVYGTHKDTGSTEGKHHLPDDVAAMGLAHLAAESYVGAIETPDMKTDHAPRKATAGFAEVSKTTDLLVDGIALAEWETQGWDDADGIMDLGVGRESADYGF